MLLIIVFGLWDWPIFFGCYTQHGYSDFGLDPLGYLALKVWIYSFFLVSGSGRCTRNFFGSYLDIISILDIQIYSNTYLFLKYIKIILKYIEITKYKYIYIYIGKYLKISINAQKYFENIKITSNN